MRRTREKKKEKREKKKEEKEEKKKERGKSPFLFGQPLRPLEGVWVTYKVWWG